LYRQLCSIIHFLKVLAYLKEMRLWESFQMVPSQRNWLTNCKCGEEREIGFLLLGEYDMHLFHLDSTVYCIISVDECVCSDLRSYGQWDII
jgi:hypothetical protein